MVVGAPQTQRALQASREGGSKVRPRIGREHWRPACWDACLSGEDPEKQSFLHRPLAACVSHIGPNETRACAVGVDRFRPKRDFQRHRRYIQRLFKLSSYKRCHTLYDETQQPQLTPSAEAKESRKPGSQDKIRGGKK
jgi:hypothetical protein